MEELFIRALQGRATAEDLARLAHWRNASPANERQYQRTAELWRDMCRLDIETTPPSPATIRRLAQAPAAIPIGSRRQYRYRATVPGGALAASIALLLLLTGDLVRQRPDAESPVLQIERLATGAFETLMTQLSDGTTVFLAPNTTLEVSPARGVREVRLEGRAFFGVAKHGEDWPFVVQARNGTVRVLGTRFEFSTETDSQRVVVVDGLVNFAVDRDRRDLGAGQMGVARGADRLQVHDVESIEEILGWMGATLVFEDTPLEQAAREIERRFGALVEITSPELARRTVSGGFKDRTFSEVVGTICRVVSADCAIGDTHAVINQRQVEMAQPTAATLTD